jgi:glycosyltransferase involved in cell wall biosynthesis
MVSSIALYFIAEYGKKIMESVDIIVPVYNEEKNIPELVRRLQLSYPEGHIVFIDNASTDLSVKLIKGYPNIKLVRHPKNEGYGKSIADGIKNSKGEFIIIIDADLEYPPEAIPAMVEELKNHDVVYGSRFLGSASISMEKFRLLGNRLITYVFNILFGQKLTDLYTGMRGIRRSALAKLEIQRSGFEAVLELSAKLVRNKVQIREIDIKYQPRKSGQSKMRHIPETIKYLCLVIIYWISLPKRS